MVKQSALSTDGNLHEVEHIGKSRQTEFQESGCSIGV
jgi:hypothetical protein